jgi:hypothetical protein
MLDQKMSGTITQAANVGIGKPAATYEGQVENVSLF